MKKKIAFVVGSLGSGGAERVISTLSNQLIETYDVRIITFKKVKPFYPLDERVKVLSCFDSIKPSSNIFQALRTNYSLYKKISCFLKEEAIDLCIGFLTSSNVLTILTAKANKIPSIVSERNNPNVARKSDIWSRMRKFTYPRAQFVVVQTERIREFFSSWIEDSKLRILPNPLSPDLNYMDISDSSRENIVLNVGRLTYQKGQETLIKAFAEINPTGWKLLILGEGNKRRDLTDLVEELNMTDKILMPGSVKDISKYYNSAKIFAFPSLYEGFPNALIEAMYMGLPCLSTDCPTGPSELISDGKNGFLVNLGDQSSFTEKLRVLIEDQDLRIKFSNPARNAVEIYNVENVLLQWQDIIVNSLMNNTADS